MFGSHLEVVYVDFQLSLFVIPTGTLFWPALFSLAPATRATELLVVRARDSPGGRVCTEFPLTFN